MAPWWMACPGWLCPGVIFLSKNMSSRRDNRTSVFFVKNHVRVFTALISMFLCPVNYFFTFACVFAIVCTYTLNFHSKYLINSDPCIYNNSLTGIWICFNKHGFRISILWPVPSLPGSPECFPQPGKRWCIRWHRRTWWFSYGIFHWVIWKPLTQWLHFQCKFFQPTKRPDQRWVLFFESPRLSDSSNLCAHVSSLRLRFYTGTYSTEDTKRHNLLPDRIKSQKTSFPRNKLIQASSVSTVAPQVPRCHF